MVFVWWSEDNLQGGWPVELGLCTGNRIFLEDVINRFDPRAVNTYLANFVLAQQVWAAVYAHRGSCEVEPTNYWVDCKCN